MCKPLGHVTCTLKCIELGIYSLAEVVNSTFIQLKSDLRLIRKKTLFFVFVCVFHSVALLTQHHHSNDLRLSNWQSHLFLTLQVMSAYLPLP